MKVTKNIIYILLIILLSFALPRIIPGNPLSLTEGELHILNLNLPEDTYNVFKEYYAPEKPIGEQFVIYIKHLLNFDLGYSFYYRMPVSRLIAGRIGWTVFLSLSSIIISSLIGIPLGLNRAIGKEKKANNFIIGFLASIQALPSFLVAILFQLIFCFRIEIFPSSGAYTPGIELFSNGFIVDVLFHAFIPLLTLVFLEIPSIFLLTYNSALKIKDENYVEMAHYLNMDDKRIKYDYIFHNSLPEVLSKVNIQCLYAISGTLFVETVFSYPGMGSLLKVAATSSDYSLLQGILLIVGIYGMFINIIFKIIIKNIDPRFENG